MTPSTGVSLILRIARTFDPGVYTTDRNNGRTAASVAIDRARIDALLAIGQDQSKLTPSFEFESSTEEQQKRRSVALEPFAPVCRDAVAGSGAMLLELIAMHLR
jgi:hypothetical protein